MTKIDDLKFEFNNYINNLHVDDVYKKALSKSFNTNANWRILRGLPIKEYLMKYSHLRGKSFYSQLSTEGLEIRNSDSGNRDAFSNVHKHLTEFIEHKIGNNSSLDEYSPEELEKLNSELLFRKESEFTWNKTPKNKINDNYEINLQRYKRDIQVAQNALIRARFLCEYDIADRVFLRKGSKKQFYTEAHHLIPLSKSNEFEYSLDIEENIVSLCSHCHNLLHYGRIEDKEPILRKLYSERKKALFKCNLDITFEQLVEYYK